MAAQSYNGYPQSSALVALALTVNSAVALAAIPSSAVTAECALTGATARLAAHPVVSVVASVPLSGATSSLRGAPVSGVLCSLVLSGATTRLSAWPSSSFKGAIQLSGSKATLTAKGTSGFLATLDLTGASDTHGMSVCGVVDEALAMWGIFCRDSAPAFAIDRALNDINTALQLVWNNADERNYWSNDTLTITLSDGENQQDLADDIQNVTGPCRREDNRRPLVPIGTLGELETFEDLYLDGESADEPLAYHIERLNQTGNDPAKCVFHVVPAVSGADVDFLLEVVKEAPRFSMADMSTCPVIPIPHRYVESLLLPIVRYQASSFYLFRQQDQKPTIDREYQQARISLGLADPLPGKAGDNLEKREGGKA